jgi:acyl-CoA reductase-like NAD-dependent aldehyde dehydrogenase
VTLEGSEAMVETMVARAVIAQRAFAHWSEARVDALLGDIADCIAAHAAPLAAATVAETGLGNVADKTLKNRLASQDVFRRLRGQPGTGVLRVDERSGVAELAAPMGVIFGLVPRTHPVATFVFKVLIALKARNALIVSCHRAAQQVGNSTGELIAGVLQAHAAPPDLVQWVRQRSDRRTTERFMQHPQVALVLATGGARMVRAAYSSGTPAIGVGPGNAPVLVCPDADPVSVADMVLASKPFDNGILCASEHNLVVERAIEAVFVAALERAGALVLRPDEAERFVAFAFEPDGHLHGALHGQSAARIARAAGLLRATAGVRLLVVPAGLDQVAGPLGREKLAPVVSLFTVSGDAEGFAVCQQILANEGAGHTAIIHTADPARIDRFAHEMPASRILVNAPGVQGTLGIATGLTPSMTLGTGTFGGTSTTDAVSYTHLLNIKRVAHPTRSAA